MVYGRVIAIALLSALACICKADIDEIQSIPLAGKSEVWGVPLSGFSHVNGQALAGGGGGGAVSPGTANLIAAWDYNNNSSNGLIDSQSSYDLTASGTSSWDTGSPNTYRGATSSDYLSSSGVGAAWGNSNQDWSLVIRFRDSALNRTPFTSGGGRNYCLWNGTFFRGAIGAGTAAEVDPDSDYTGVFVTLVIEYDSSAESNNIFFLNENKEASTTEGTHSWAGTSTALIGANNGDGGVIDFIYLFDRRLTAAERLFFGDNSSEPIEFSDL